MQTYRVENDRNEKVLDLASRKTAMAFAKAKSKHDGSQGYVVVENHGNETLRYFDGQIMRHN